jgi:hypothetical protein
MMMSTTDMVQCDVTPTIVAGICGPGVPTTAGLTEAGYNAGPIGDRAEKPAITPKSAFFEPCPTTHNPNELSPVRA